MSMTNFRASDMPGNNKNSDSEGSAPKEAEPKTTAKKKPAAKSTKKATTKAKEVDPREAAEQVTEEDRQDLLEGDVDNWEEPVSPTYDEADEDAVTDEDREELLKGDD